MRTIQKRYWESLIKGGLSLLVTFGVLVGIDMFKDAIPDVGGYDLASSALIGVSVVMAFEIASLLMLSAGAKKQLSAVNLGAAPLALSPDAREAFADATHQLLFFKTSAGVWRIDRAALDHAAARQPKIQAALDNPL